MALYLHPEGRGWKRWLAGCNVSWTMAITLQSDSREWVDAIGFKSLPMILEAVWTILSSQEYLSSLVQGMLVMEVLLDRTQPFPRLLPEHSPEGCCPILPTRTVAPLAWVYCGNSFVGSSKLQLPFLALWASGKPVSHSVPAAFLSVFLFTVGRGHQSHRHVSLEQLICWHDHSSRNRSWSTSLIDVLPLSCCIWGLCSPTFPSHLSFLFSLYLRGTWLTSWAQCMIPIAPARNLVFLFRSNARVLVNTKDSFQLLWESPSQRKGNGNGCPFGVHQPGAALHTASMPAFVTVNLNTYSNPRHCILIIIMNT